MKKTLPKILGSNVDPLFFAFFCLLLIVLSLSAQAFVQDIAKESDDGAENFRLAHTRL